jgi:ketosteroid isomerase-like protein
VPAVALAALAAAGALAAALACASPPPPDPQDRREALADAGDRLWDAYARQDLDEMKRWLDDDAVLIGEERIEGNDGIVAFLRRYMQGLQVQGWVHTQRSLRLAGEVGLVSYWRDETGLADEAPYRDANWVNEAWIERDGRWRCLLIHFGANQSAPPELEE